MGPSAIRVAGLATRLTRLGYDVQELGAVFVQEPEVCPVGEHRTKYLQEVKSCCVELREKALDVLSAGSVPLVLGGDHSVAIGSIAAEAIHQRRRGLPVGLLWIDAHADMNTPETSPSGNIHGMPLAVCLGQGAKELTEIAGGPPAVLAQHVAILGARDLDREERRFVKEWGVRVFTMSELDERGIATCMDEAHLPRGAPRLREGGSHGQAPRDGPRRAESHPRRGQPHGAPRGRAHPVRVRQDDLVGATGGRPLRREDGPRDSARAPNLYFAPIRRRRSAYGMLSDVSSWSSSSVPWYSDWNRRSLAPSSASLSPFSLRAP